MVGRSIIKIKELLHICWKEGERRTEELCTNEKKENITLGYDWDSWKEFGMIEPVLVDISPKTNTHSLLAGLSGSGKSYTLLRYLAKIAEAGTAEDEYYFADYKQDDSFEFLRNCRNYYPYKKTLEALDKVYDKLQKRQSGEDTSRHGITLIIDEYASFILALQSEDKKKATETVNRIAEILMLGRSLAVRIIIAVQRPDAKLFENGARINFGIIMVLGSALKSSYEMVMPREYIDEIGERKFSRGEGIALFQGSELRFIKIPFVRDMETMQNICIQALSQ